jgi:hypothetical protein
MALHAEQIIMPHHSPGYSESSSQRCVCQILDCRSKGLSRIASARLIEVCDKVYNEVRLHNALGVKPPAHAAWITVAEPLQRLGLA